MTVECIKISLEDIPHEIADKIMHWNDTYRPCGYMRDFDPVFNCVHREKVLEQFQEYEVRKIHKKSESIYRARFFMSEDEHTESEIKGVAICLEALRTATGKKYALDESGRGNVSVGKLDNIR